MNHPGHSPKYKDTFWVLFLSMLVVGMSQTVIFAVMPMLGRELKLDQIVFDIPLLGTWQPREFAITSLSALTALTFFLTTPWWGRRSDAVGRKPIIIIGLIGYALGMLLFNGAAHAGLIGVSTGLLLYLSLVVTRVIHSSVTSAMHPAAMAYIVDCTEVEERIQGVSKMAAANQVGVMVGPALAWFAAISFLAPFYIQATLMFACGLLVWWILPESPLQFGKAVQNTKQQTVQHQATKKNKKVLSYFDPRFRLYIGIGVVMFTMLGMVQQTLGFYFQDRLGLDGVSAAQQYSVAMVVSSAAMLFAQLVVVERAPWRPHTFLITGLPFCMLGYAVLAFAFQEWSLYLGMAIFGFGSGLAQPGLTTCATLMVEPHEQGALAGLTGAAAGLGFVFGPLTGGIIYRYDPSYPYLLASIVVGVLSVYVWRADPDRLRRTSTNLSS